jgi:hypothetical protein
VAVFGSLMTVSVMHRFAMKFLPMFGHMRVMLGIRAMIPVPIVVMVIYVTIEVLRAVKPGACADKYTT